MNRDTGTSDDIKYIRLCLTRARAVTIDREYLIFFEHDPLVAAGYIREEGGRRFVEQVL